MNHVQTRFLGPELGSLDAVAAESRIPSPIKNEFGKTP